MQLFCSENTYTYLINFYKFVALIAKCKDNAAETIFIYTRGVDANIRFL